MVIMKVDKKNRMGRNPLGKAPKARDLEQPDGDRETRVEPTPVLFQRFVTPPGSIEKLKEMQIKVDWTELYRSVASDLKKIFFMIPLLGLTLSACANKPVSNAVDDDIKKQITEIQKVLGRQSTQIEEINNKILLLTDRLDSKEKTAALAPSIPSVPTPVLVQTGDAKLFEMVSRDLKSHNILALEKNVALMKKGFKESPLTEAAQFLLGEIYFKNHDFQKSAGIFEKLYAASPDGTRAVSSLYYLGLSYQKLNRIQEAKEAFQGIINVYPGSRQALEATKIMASLKKGAKTGDKL